MQATDPTRSEHVPHPRPELLLAGGIAGFVVPFVTGVLVHEWTSLSGASNRTDELWVGLWALVALVVTFAMRETTWSAFWGSFAFVAAATAAAATEDWWAILLLVPLAYMVLFVRASSIVRWVAIVPALVALIRATEIVSNGLPGAGTGYAAPIGVLFIGGFLALWGWREENTPARRVAWLSLVVFGLIALIIGIRDVINTTDAAAALLMATSVLAVGAAGWGLWNHRTPTGPESV